MYKQHELNNEHINTNKTGKKSTKRKRKENALIEVQKRNLQSSNQFVHKEKKLTTPNGKKSIQLLDN